MYSLSTCWNSHRHTDGRAMLREIRELGFEYAELSHGIRISLLPGIIEAVEAGEINISSLHNFCPLPMGITYAAPNIYQFTAHTARERDRAHKQTLKTLETAARLKASLVVLHMGSIEMRDYGDKLTDMLGAGEKETPRYAKLCEEFLKVRESKKEWYLARAIEELKKLAPEAEKHGLKLGVENREALEEIPFEGDYYRMFQEVTSPAVGYWHDTGHAQIKENLGFCKHALQLEMRADRLLGFHIHDVKLPARDHCPPGTGVIDFAGLQPFVRPHHLKVFEIGPGTPPEDLQKGVAYLKEIWGKE